MPKDGWADYSGATPILLPVSLLFYWQGFFLPTAEDDVADLELPEGQFTICTDFDFAHPKTDYDRACGLGGVPAVQSLPVGPGYGLVFATELDSLTWWQEERMLVNGGSLPEITRFQRVTWSDELVWQATESDFVLMNACEHGANPQKGSHFKVRLELGEYIVQWGQYEFGPTMISSHFCFGLCYVVRPLLAIQTDWGRCQAPPKELAPTGS